MSNFAPPKGYHTPLSPYLMVPDPEVLIDFILEVFQAKMKMKILRADGGLNSAEIYLGESVLMLSGSSQGFGPFETMQHVYVSDVDACFARAIARGATEVMPPSQQFYGDYAAGVKGPQGNYWWIANRTVEMTEAEIQQATLDRKE